MPARVGLGLSRQPAILAPWSIQARSRPTCSAVSGGPSGGIRSCGSVSVTRSMIRLPSAVPRHDRRPAVSALPDRHARVQPEPRLLLQRPVAGVAASLQDRLDPTAIVDRLRRRGPSGRQDDPGDQNEQTETSVR